ncbi:MAG: aconitate hydratase [Actinobacteria bacterium]|nr:aconitate hydratase [Actinomycetota bacterium]MCL6105053.1 aconitate hydratase [Actinomycetota bacterium]
MTSNNTQSTTDIGLVRNVHKLIADTTMTMRKQLARPLTLAEKILFAHLRSPYTESGGDRPAEVQIPIRQHSYATLYPDRVAMQDATAQMALLQFMTAGMDAVAVSSSVHCDHLIQAQVGADQDLARALEANMEVYEFLKSASERYGIGYWSPGSGIIHQVVLEQYAFPGGMLVGTDSHTPNAGGLSMIAIGVGGADAVDVMVGTGFNLRWPKLIGVHLKGLLNDGMNGWTAPKDVILKVADILTVAGGTGAIIEYFGPGTKSISATGKATICNMGAEVGATCSLFPYDHHTASYLSATGRAEIAESSDQIAGDLQVDPEVEERPEDFFDQVIEIDLSTLEPQISGPHTPDRVRPTSKIGEEAKAEKWPLTLSYCLVGSCTNSSYEDISKAAVLAAQAVKNGLKVKTPLLITPGSQKVHDTIQRDGLLKDLEAIGATVLANACGPCIGQWKRSDIEPSTPNSILTSYNRNFPKRNDGNPQTLAFIASPEIVVAYALFGRLDFNPLKDTIDGVKLIPPAGEELPAKGFSATPAGFIPPSDDPQSITVKVDPASQRLQLLEPFEPWDGNNFTKLPILLKAKGKCTTDQISPAGEWLKYRGHLENISGNLFSGVTNAYSGEVGTGFCLIHNVVEPYPSIARHYKAAKWRWTVIGDNNYGEGSSREHAAMEPRYMGCVVVIAKSFARIHETNLKTQGVLPLTFVDSATYDKIGEKDRISTLDLADLAPDKPVNCRIVHADNTSEEFSCSHTMAQAHIEWFKAGSALNLINNHHSRLENHLKDTPRQS